MRVFRYVLGVLTIVCGVVAAVYVAIFVLLMGGIGNIVNGAKHNPTQVGRIVWGVIEIVPLIELAAGAIIWAAIGLAAFIMSRPAPRLTRARPANRYRSPSSRRY